MRRFLITTAASVALTLATALPIRATGLTLVTISCGDGDSFSATVDANTLTGLQSSIEALTLYPAGLSCTLGMMDLAARRLVADPRAALVSAGVDVRIMSGSE